MPVVVKIISMPKLFKNGPKNRFPNIINKAIPSTISGKAMGRSKILFNIFFKGKEYLENE